MIKGIRINKSKIVHLYWEGADRTDCGAGGMSDISVNGGVPTDDAVTCKRCLKTIAAEVEQAHAEALVIDAELVRALSALAGMMDRLHAEALAEDLERSSRPHWVADQSGTWRGKGGEAYTCDLPVKRGAPGHDGLCFDRVAGVQRPAPVLSRRQRSASRRASRVTLRRQAPQMRAAARARRAQRGTARATAQTLLVASGVPQDAAERYASAFSRGAQAETVPMRIRTGARRSKRVDVKRYTWLQFRARLRVYRPAALAPRVWFNEAAGRVGVLA